MPLDLSVGPVSTLKYKGVFDYNGLTTFIINWLQDRGYETNEKVHKHKLSCPKGFEIERLIEGWVKFDGYWQDTVTVSIKLLDAFEVEAVKDGKKQKLWNARIIVVVNGSVVADYNDRWGKTAFLRKLRNFYTFYIIKKEFLFARADPHYYKLLSLNQAIKKFIGMETHAQF